MNQRGQEFEELAFQLAQWWVRTNTSLALDELSPQIMNSRAKREELAMYLGEWAKDLFSKVAEAIEGNYNGKAQVGGVGIPDLIHFGAYAPLNKGYLTRKTSGYSHGKTESGGILSYPPLPASSFFRLSGALTKAIRGIPDHLPPITPNMVRVRRVVESEVHRYDKKLRRYATIKVRIDELGRFSREPLTSGWQVSVYLPPQLSATNLADGELEKLLLPDDPLSQAKLLNSGVGKRPFRPLLKPYVSWFLVHRVDDVIRYVYSKQRRK